MIESVGEYLDRKVRSLQGIGRIMTTNEAHNEVNDIRAGLGLPARDFTKDYLHDMIKRAFRSLN